MGPYSLALRSKKKVGIEFVGRDWAALRRLFGIISGSLGFAKHLAITNLLYQVVGLGDRLSTVLDLATVQ